MPLLYYAICKGLYRVQKLLDRTFLFTGTSGTQRGLLPYLTFRLPYTGCGGIPSWLVWILNYITKCARGPHNPLEGIGGRGSRHCSGRYMKSPNVQFLGSKSAYPEFNQCSDSKQVLGCCHNNAKCIYKVIKYISASLSGLHSYSYFFLWMSLWSLA